MKFYSNKKSGFTLIELLVVIAIISLLSSVVLTSTGKSRMKSRDAKRQQDITQLRNALASYASDNNGKYPGTTDFIINSGHDELGNPTWNTANPFFSALVPKYIARLPVDPLNTPTLQSTYDFIFGMSPTAHVYTYAVSSTGSDYDLTYNYELPGHRNSCEKKTNQVSHAYTDIVYNLCTDFVLPPTAASDH
ncbi:MAG: type II secretion system protein [Patescibacteria group bacterium]